MKIVLAALLVTSSAAFAQSLSVYSEPSYRTSPNASETMASLHRAATGRYSASDVTAKVATEAPNTVFIFPIVGSVAGGNGTFFRTDATLVNRLSRTQYYDAFFFPLGAGCSGLKLQSISLFANSWYNWPDVVSQLFGSSGLGSIIVFATDANHNYDGSAKIDGFVRIWTQIPGTSGTASQAFSPVPLSQYPSGEMVSGLRQDANYRTNIGVFNYLPPPLVSTRTFDIYVSGATGTAQTSITVEPCSMVQRAIPSGNFGALAVGIVPRDTLGGWYGFASTVDNTSGDSWSATARP